MLFSLAEILPQMVCKIYSNLNENLLVLMKCKWKDYGIKHSVTAPAATALYSVYINLIKLFGVCLQEFATSLLFCNFRNKQDF